MEFLMKKDTFEYVDYRSYVSDLLASQPKKGHGFRSKLATVIGCRPAYITLVLKGQANLSLEQADLLCAHFGLTSEEADFFLLLVQFERAGSASLRQRL